MLDTNTASYKSLLEIIQDKEKELSRIRQTANVVAEEEKIAAHRKFSELLEDFHHNLDLLRDKDETIKKLERCIVQLEKDHSDSLKVVEERCQERATLEIAKAASKAEEQFRKKFRIEYEEKLSASEREMKKDYQMALVRELHNQEEMLSEKFDCVLSRLESDHRQQLNDIYRQLEQKKKELIDMESASRTKLRDIKARVVLEADARLEKTVAMKIKECELQSEMNIRKLIDEKELLGDKLRQLEHMQKDIEIRNKDLIWKNDELLGIIQNLEQSYMEKIHDFEVERKKWITHSKEIQEKSRNLEASLRECKEKHRNQLRDLENQAQTKRKSLSREIRKLAKKLAKAKEEKEEVEELMREKVEEEHTSKQQLKEKITSLKTECRELRRQINSCHGIVSSASASDESCWKEELNKTFKIKEDALTASRREMRSRFEREMKLTRNEFEREIQGLARERDEILTQRDAMKRKMFEHENDFTNLRTKLFRENEKLKSNLCRLEEQNVQLKGTIKEMRREMESLIALHRERGSESESESKSTPCQDEQSLHNNIPSDYNNFSQRSQDVEKLEKNLQHLTSEYNSIVNERDRLLVISNQLQVQINRLRDRCRCVKNVDCRSIDNAEHDNVDIQDLDGLAKSIWAGPLINQSKPKQATKASERATRSQELYLKKKREGSNASTLPPKAKNIRNWNIKED